MPNRNELLAVARAEAEADVVLAGGQVVNVFSGQVEAVDIAVFDGVVAGLGDGYAGKQRIDLRGAYVAPGLIDAHVHIESSLCVPPQFAAAVVPRGVTTAVIDPHELANVVGAAGVRYMAEASRGLPMNAVVMGPSCVPATPMATAGGSIDAGELQALLDEGLIHGLAEAMDFPGVIHNHPGMRAKLEAFAGRAIDGHCPGLRGTALNAYIAAGVGSDHECVDPGEAREKLARGLYVLIREATNARNLDALLPIVTNENARRVCFCTDDRTPCDLLDEGSIDMMVRRAIAFGIAPIEAIRMATLNPAEWLGLTHLGAVAPGKQADCFVFDDLKAPEARMVFHRGRSVAEDGLLLTPPASLEVQAPEGTCRVNADGLNFTIEATTDTVRVIGSVRDQLVTEHLQLSPTVEDGLAVADPIRDLLKIAVIERHRGTGNVGLGFIRGFGLRRGAIAGTVAHDHHNLVVIGADDESMLHAARLIAEIGGGLCCCDGAKSLAQLAMPIGGLMSDRPVAEVASAYASLLEAARTLGASLDDPYMAMGFMGLEVIPSLKLTDQGLIDVDRFERAPLFVD
ncbi:MAG: adenine deaminase [Planctomycetota bacterium]